MYIITRECRIRLLIVGWVKLYKYNNDFQRKSILLIIQKKVFESFILLDRVVISLSRVLLSHFE